MRSYKLAFGKHAKFFFGIKSMNLFPATPLTHFSYLEVGVLSGMHSKLLHHPPTSAPSTVRNNRIRY